MKKTLYLIACNDGVVYQNKEGKTFFSWDYDSMRKYASVNDASGIFKTIFYQLYHDTTDLDYNIVFVHSEKSMHELM